MCARLCLCHGGSHADQRRALQRRDVEAAGRPALVRVRIRVGLGLGLVLGLVLGFGFGLGLGLGRGPGLAETYMSLTCTVKPVGAPA